MLRVLLTDDEPFIVQGLKVLIDWEEQGFEIAGTAANGLEALAFLRKASVDLVLADIKMPSMSGLELLERVRSEKLSDAYFVFLSGYSDFNFAKKAIQYSCMDYMLKPVQKAELLHVLQRVKSVHADAKRRRKREQEQENALLERNVISLLHGKADHMNLDYVKKFLPDIFGIRYIDMEAAAGAADKRQMQRQLHEACVGFLKEDACRCIFDASGKEENYDVGFLYSSRMAETIGMTEQEYLNKLLDWLKEALPVPVVMYVGCHVEGLAHISQSYRTALVARSFYNFSAGDKEASVAWYREGKENRQGEILLKNSLDTLVQAVEENTTDSITSMVDALYEEMSGIGTDYRLVDLNIGYLLFRLVHLAKEQDEHVNQEEILKMIGLDAFDSGTMRGSPLHLKRFVCAYAEYLVELRGKTARGVMMQIEKEIKVNFAQNMTLKDLSKKYYINSAYLGQLFKKQYGMSFKDFLNGKRIEEAASLLLHTDLKNYEIAERVGYHDLDYFINKFIAIKGCTPAKFRKNTR